jgi:hypothetical protein
MWEHMIGIESCYPFCIDSLTTWDEYGHLHAVMVCDGKDGVVPLRWGEVYYQVQGDHFEGEGIGICSNGVYWYSWLGSSAFGLLAYGTSFDILCNELLHLGPPVVLSDELVSFENSRVFCQCVIMEA